VRTEIIELLASVVELIFHTHHRRASGLLEQRLENSDGISRADGDLVLNEIPEYLEQSLDFPTPAHDSLPECRMI
jgi:hypothetical protein